MTIIEQAKKMRADTKETLQTMCDAMNHDQLEKLLKYEKVKALLGRFGVEITAEADLPDNAEICGGNDEPEHEIM